MVLGLQRWVIFPRYAPVPDPEMAKRIDGLERWTRNIGDGEVEAWFMPGRGVSEASPGPAVIFAHGNAELIDHWPETLEAYREMGVSVLLAEYRGYGRSDGTPSQTGITDDYVAFHDRLAGRAEVDASRIVFHGRSLGGGVVCALADERRPAAMILMSTFTSLAEMAKKYLLPRFMVLDPFDNVRVLQQLEVPVLLVHGRRDELIPYEHAQRLAEVAHDARLRSYDAGHNDCPPDWELFWKELRTFLTEHGVLS